MMLSTHAVAGGLVATLFPSHPAVAFVAGFASHFALDALPHWDYKLRSIKKDDDPLKTDMELGSQFIFDIARIALDIAIGFAVAFIAALVLSASPMLVFVGAFGGVLPDGLQFVFFKTRMKLMEPLQRFHIWIQKGRSLHIASWKGMSLQAALVIALAFVVQHIR